MEISASMQTSNTGPDMPVISSYREITHLLSIFYNYENEIVTVRFIRNTNIILPRIPNAL